MARRYELSDVPDALRLTGTGHACGRSVIALRWRPVRRATGCPACTRPPRSAPSSPTPSPAIPGGPHVVEQQAYLAPGPDGTIAWMRVLCSGYRPLDAAG